MRCHLPNAATFDARTTRECGQHASPRAFARIEREACRESDLNESETLSTQIGATARIDATIKTSARRVQLIVRERADVRLRERRYFDVLSVSGRHHDGRVIARPDVGEHDAFAHSFRNRL